MNRIRNTEARISDKGLDFIHQLENFKSEKYFEK